MNRSILIESVRSVRLIDNPLPVRKEGEALLKLLYGGICGSDLGSYRGNFAYFSYPRVPGHEFSAEIMEIDENEYGLEKGMIVTCNPYFNCGICYSCRRGFLNCCEDNQTMGVQREGAFSRYITMPLERIYDGRGLAAKTLALVEPFCIGLHGIRRANIQPGNSVLIVGAGTIGILAAKAAKILGADVTICDVVQDKLDLARRLGFEKTILNSDPAKFMDQVRQITDDNGFDVTVEAVGLPSTFQNCLDAAAFAGKVVVVGVSKWNIDLFYTIIQKKELNIYGSRNAMKEDFLYTINLLHDGKLELDDIVTDVYDFEDGERAFREFDENQGEKLKVLIRF